MEKVVSRAPARVDLAGGSLDLWPMGLMVGDALTVNVAVSLFAEVVCTPREGPVLLRSDDLGACYEWDSDGPHGALPLVERFCEHFGVHRNWEIRTAAGSPPGAGLGGSSAMSIALAGALAVIRGKAIEDRAFVALCRDLEAVQLGIPTGVQDFWPALLGGALTIRYVPGGDEVERIETPLEKLAERMIVAFSGRSRLSSGTNWGMMKRFLDGETQTRSALEGVARAARTVRESLLVGDLDAVARGVAQEWSHRKKLAPGVATSETDLLESAAAAAGALGWKACGAGGGGCMVFLAREGRQAQVQEALARAGASVLDARPVASGRTVEVVL
jgi:D-glycero-alpha-D-manno-heptose-7-phosphate kinase